MDFIIKTREIKSSDYLSIIMAKPLRIFLVRHGESEGNVNRSLYLKKPDHRIRLTENGIRDAEKAGKFIQEKIFEYEQQIPPSHRSPVKCKVYCSTFKRSRETFEGMKPYLEFPGFEPFLYQEDPRIREQEWGNYQQHYDTEVVLLEREDYTSFYYRIPQGESGADVYDRLSGFMDGLFRDFEKHTYPENTIIVSHGFTIRIFLMRWFHWSPEEFETLVNPPNGAVIELHLNPATQKYELKTELIRKKARVYTDN